MAKKEPGVNNTATKPEKNKGLVPPEEQFWKRYSAHHEFPLSTASSILLHAIGFAVLIVGWAILSHYGLLGKPKVEVGAIEIAGGGGSPDGAEGPPTGVEKKEAVVAPNETAKLDPLKPDELNKIDNSAKKIIEDAKDTERLIGEAGTVSTQMAAVSESLRQKVAAAVAGAASKGRRGTGQGGGDGKGVGTGKGDLSGPGTARIGRREKRQQRWVMIFNTRDGQDYARQLNGLKAVLAVPVPGEEGVFQVMEDLSQRPVQLKQKNLSDINKIYWIDDKPESVTSLARAFGITPTPAYIVAFFPEELEQELLDKELKWRNAAEDSIEETRFVVRRSSSGYQPQVVDQRIKRR